MKNLFVFLGSAILLGSMLLCGVTVGNNNWLVFAGIFFVGGLILMGVGRLMPE